MKPKQKTKRKQRRIQCKLQSKVFVVDKKERPLMPCSPRIAKKLLKQGKARIFKHGYTGFFAIKLNYVPEKRYLQHNTIGIDTGSQNIGIAVVRKANNNGKVSRTVTHLFEVKMRSDEITKNLEQRRMYRINRRGRKTRYRKPRWLNRSNSRKEGRITPTMKHKFDTHCRVIDTLKSLLPRHSLVLEVGQFDLQLMKNEGKPFNRHWGYQKGVSYGFENRKAYVLWRDNYKCQCCKKINIPLQVHHIVYRSNGGSDNEDNLITLCEKCHKAIHEDTRKLRKQGLKKNLKNATQMNHLKSLLVERYPKANITLGFITKANRQKLGLEKTHYNDAVAIACCGKEVKFETNEVMKLKRIPKGYYKLYDGKGSEHRLPNQKKLWGCQPGDKIRYFGKVGFINGMTTKGYICFFRNIDSEDIDTSNAPPKMKTPKPENTIRISTRRSWMCQKQAI